MKNLIILFSLFLFNTLFAQVSITTGNLISIDFNSFDGSGFAPEPAAGRLDSDEWRATGFSDGDGVFGGTHNTLDFARGVDSDGTTAGGIYSFEVSSGDYSLGVQPISSDFTPGTFTLRLINNTGSTLTELNIQYDIYVLNDQSRSNSFNFSYSDDDVSYTGVGALDFASPEAADAPASWISSFRNITISTLNIANNDTLYLQWSGDDISGAGSRDEFALDNILISEGDTPLPIELTSFRAIGGDQKITLRWSTASEINNQGYEIWRSYQEDDGYELVSSFQFNENLRGAGTTSLAHNYNYTDFSLVNNQQYWYKLVDVSFSGEREEHGPISARPHVVAVSGPATLPDEFSLYDNYPNPFNPKTSIKFDVPAIKNEAIFMTLNIYNILGQKVITLFNGMIEPGFGHEYNWYGVDQNGKAVPSGLYIYQIESDHFVQSKKMMMVK